MGLEGLETDKDTFLYFGYGSNMLKSRLTLRNPSAVFITIAKLQDWRLGFDKYSKTWRGCAATIDKSPGDECWGCVWRLKRADMDSLDEQEDVQNGVYKSIEVEVEAPSGEKMKCRTYFLLMRDAEDKRPSPHYLGVIIKGAEENSIIPEYLARLKAIEHNGYNGEVAIMKQIVENEKEGGQSAAHDRKM